MSTPFLKFFPEVDNIAEIKSSVLIVRQGFQDFKILQKNIHTALEWQAKNVHFIGVEKNNTNFMESILTYSYKKMVRYKIYFFLKKKVVKILGKIVKVFSVTELTLWPNSQAKIFQKAIYKVSRFPIYM